MQQAGRHKRVECAGARVRSRALLSAAALWLAASLGGCGSISEKVSEAAGGMPGVGLPSGVPERPAVRAAYPAVHDMPPPRTTAVLNSNEQRDIEKELVAAREQQKIAAQPPPAEESAPAPAAKKPATRPKPAASTSPLPASSARSIY